MNPSAHWHVWLSPTGMHVPSCWHGLGSQPVPVVSGTFSSTFHTAEKQQSNGFEL